MLLNGNSSAKFRYAAGWRLCARGLTVLCTLSLSVLTLPTMNVVAESASGEGAANGDSSGRTDVYGDPLPEGAIARLGTVRFRHGAQINGIAFSPDGKTVASAGGGRFIKIWEVGSGKLLRTVDSGATRVASFAWSHDGKLFAGVCRTFLRGKPEPTELYLRIWDAESGREKAAIKGLKGGHRLAFSPDDGTILVASEGGSLRFFDVAACEEILDFKLSARRVKSVAFSPDGKTLAAADYNRGIHLWNWQAGEEPRVVELAPRGVTSVAFSPDGKIVAAGDDLTGVRLLEVASGRVVRPLKSEEKYEEHVQLLFTPDGKTLASNCRGALVLWDLATGKLARSRISSVATDVKQLAISPDSRFLATGGWNGVVRVWNIAAEEEIAGCSEAHAWYPNRVAFSPQQGVLATSSDDGTVRLWDSTTGRQRLRLEHEGWVRGMAISPDGKLLASSSLAYPDNAVRLWDTASGHELHKLRGHGRTGAFRALAFAPDGKSLISWGDDMYIRVWHVDTGKLKAEHVIRSSDGKIDVPKDERPYSFSPIEHAGLSPDGKTLVLATRDDFYVFEAATGKELRKVPYEDGLIMSIAFSPDGKRLLTIALCNPVETPDGFSYQPSGDVVRVRDLATGKLLLKTELAIVAIGQSGPAVFSSDGRVIAVAVGEVAIRLFEAATGKELFTISGPPVGILSLAFSTDGKLLASGMYDTSTLIWDISRATTE